MADQTTNREPDFQENFQKHLLASNLHFFRGEMVAWNGTNQYVVKAADTAAMKLAGVVRSETDLTAVAAGAERVPVWRQGTFKFLTSGTAPKPGDLVYMVDSQTVAIASVTTNDIAVGTVEEIPATGYAIVKINAL